MITDNVKIIVRIRFRDKVKVTIDVRKCFNKQITRKLYFAECIIHKFHKRYFTEFFLQNILQISP